MCGIAGLILKPGATPDAALLQRLIGALAHRGPDGSGHHVAGQVALAHNRLAIIDLATGDQPLFAGPAALVGNGEVYNYRELREENQLGCATGSDCEPPLHLYRRDGLGFADRLRGMYALAIHDRAARQVVLARDPFGIKPLYLAETSEGIAFASEAQALIGAGLVLLLPIAWLQGFSQVLMTAPYARVVEVLAREAPPVAPISADTGLEPL